MDTLIVITLDAVFRIDWRGKGRREKDSEAITIIQVGGDGWDQGSSSEGGVK